MTSGHARSAQIRSTLTHPVVDGDGHWVEPVPIFLDFLHDEGGAAAVRQFQLDRREADEWYRVDASSRSERRITRPAWWVEPGNTLDRATAANPGLYYERLDEMGVDYAIVYPTLALAFLEHGLADYRRIAIRAANRMSAELFAPYADRMTPVATVSTSTPDEACDELAYCTETLGLKALMAPGHILRIAPDGRTYVDAIALDSPFEYDQFWASCVERGVAVTDHSTSLRWPERRSVSNYVANHLGHFAASQHFNCRSTFLGGVPLRFPTLNFAFLEGGIGWARNLLSDLVSHWEKRNRGALVSTLSPRNLDGDEFVRLYENHATGRLVGRGKEVIAHPSVFAPFTTLDELVTREGPVVDDFEASGVRSSQDIAQLFSSRFYFGCEPDDPMTTLAYDTRFGQSLKAVFSSDVGHFDVPLMDAVLAEAWELVEHGLLNEAQFREFTFTNVVNLHGQMNPNFFDGTVVEAAARADLLLP